MKLLLCLLALWAAADAQSAVRSKPVVIRLQPERTRPHIEDVNSQAPPATQRPSNRLVTRPPPRSRVQPQPRPRPQPKPQPIKPTQVVRQQPVQQAPPPPPPKLEIPPQLAQLLGLNNLFPGLIAPQTSAQLPQLPVAANPALAGFNQGLLGQFGATPNLASLANAQGLPGGLPAGLISQLSSGLQGTGLGSLSGLGGGAFNSFGAPSVGPGLTSANVPLPAYNGGANNGLLGLLGTVTRQLTQASGLQNVLQQAQAGGGLPAIPGLSGRAPPVAGLPRIPGIPLLPGGIPRNSQGQVDIVNLLSAITRRVSNGTTLADVLPPSQLQQFADNLTDVLLPNTPPVDLTKMMGRWFEGINSPRATEQRCVVHHYGGLTHNGKTATFTALKIYREGSEFGQVRYSIGYAFRGGHRNAMLQMHTSESSDSIPFWIYKVGPEGQDPFGNPQYEYAVVSNWVKYPVTVLVRDPDTFKQKYEQEVLRDLEKHGFINGFIRAFNMLQPASYKNCQYADSTFQVFGR